MRMMENIIMVQYFCMYTKKKKKILKAKYCTQLCTPYTSRQDLDGDKRLL